MARRHDRTARATLATDRAAAGPRRQRLAAARVHVTWRRASPRLCQRGANEGPTPPWVRMRTRACAADAPGTRSGRRVEDIVRFIDATRWARLLGVHRFIGSSAGTGCGLVTFVRCGGGGSAGRSRRTLLFAGHALRFRRRVLGYRRCFGHRHLRGREPVGGRSPTHQRSQYQHRAQPGGRPALFFRQQRRDGVRKVHRLWLAEHQRRWRDRSRHLHGRDGVRRGWRTPECGSRRARCCRPDGRGRRQGIFDIETARLRRRGGRGRRGLLDFVASAPRFAAGTGEGRWGRRRAGRSRRRRLKWRRDRGAANGGARQRTARGRHRSGGSGAHAGQFRRRLHPRFLGRLVIERGLRTQLRRRCRHGRWATAGTAGNPAPAILGIASPGSGGGAGFGCGGQAKWTRVSRPDGRRSVGSGAWPNPHIVACDVAGRSVWAALARALRLALASSARGGGGGASSCLTGRVARRSASVEVKILAPLTPLGLSTEWATSSSGMSLAVPIDAASVPASWDPPAPKGGGAGTATAGGGSSRSHRSGSAPRISRRCAASSGAEKPSPVRWATVRNASASSAALWYRSSTCGASARASTSSSAGGNPARLRGTGRMGMP